MKAIKILIVIIIVLAIILGIKILRPKKSETNKVLTIEEVKEIVAKSENIKNYTYKSNYNGEEILRKHNNNKECFELNGNKNYIDYEKNESIVIMANSKKALIMENTTIKEHIKNFNESFYFTAENSEEYKYIGEEEFKGKKCIVIELSHKYEEIEGLDWYFNNSEKNNINEKYKDEMIKNKIWIAKEEGVILKIVSSLGDEETVQEFDIEINCVSEEEVKVPDLSGYEIIDTRKK